MNETLSLNKMSSWTIKMKLKLILTSNAAKTQKTNEKMSFKTKLRYLTYHGFESDEKNQKKVEIC